MPRILGLDGDPDRPGLGVMRQAPAGSLNGRAGISVLIAIRLTQAFGRRHRRGWACKWPTISGRPRAAPGRSQWSAWVGCDPIGPVLVRTRAVWQLWARRGPCAASDSSDASSFKPKGAT